MRTAHRPLSIRVRLARTLVPLLTLLLVMGELLPVAPAVNAVAAQPSFAAVADTAGLDLR